MSDTSYKNNISTPEYDSLGYASDGLVSMFDAEWNTLSENDVRKHIELTNTWSDIGKEKLIGDIQLMSKGNIKFGYDRVDLSKSGALITSIKSRIVVSAFKPIMPEQYTFELCVRNFTSDGADPTFFAGILGGANVRPSIFVFQDYMMCIWGSGPAYKEVYFEHNLSWNHLHTFSCSFAKTGSSLYLDGMRISAGGGESFGIATNPFRINSHNTTDNAQEGCYHCFRMYSRILSEADVLCNWENDKRRFES